MKRPARNFALPFVLFGSGFLLLLWALGALPTNSDDVLRRAWPIILVMLGLNGLLFGRLRYGNWIALALSLGILGGVIAAAYASLGNEPRDEYQTSLSENPISLEGHIQSLTLDVEMLNTVVIVRSSSHLGPRLIQADYVGSSESRVRMSAQENSPGVVDIRITEERPNRIPNLSRVGSGELIIYLPSEVELSNLRLDSGQGAATLALGNLMVSGLDIRIEAGSLRLEMPPASAPSVIGDVALANGNLTLLIDPSIPIELNNAPPRQTLDDNIYLPLSTGNIQSAGTTEGDFRVRLRLDIPNGTLTIQAAGSGN